MSRRIFLIAATFALCLLPVLGTLAETEAKTAKIAHSAPVETALTRHF